MIWGDAYVRRPAVVAGLVGLLAGLLSAVSAPTNAAAEDPGPVAVEFTTAPSISGVTRVGRRLRVDRGMTNPPDVTWAQQWLRDGAPIAGATRSSYVLTAADLWRRISVEVTASAEGAEPASATSATTPAIRKGRMRMSRSPKVRGWPKVGRTLRAKPKAWSISPSPKRVKIKWILNQRVIKWKTNHRKFPLRPWMRGKRVKVKFIYQAPAGYKWLRRKVVKEPRVKPRGNAVNYPAAAPRPKWINRNRRAVGLGPNRRITRIPDGVWQSMKGRSWHRGCPVGRSQLRLVRINYWDYRGERRRGVLVVHRAIAWRAANALADMHRGRYPVRRMHRVDRFGWSARLQGADDYASMRAGNTSAFNCRSVVGRPGVRSPHSYGRAVDLNPWENPYYSRQDGWVPNRWWVSRSHPRIAWRSMHHPVIRIWRSHGFRWTYGRSDAHHVDGRAVPSHGAGFFVAD